MAFSVLNRRPDSGLGNVRSSPGDPSRNIDWVLLLVQSALVVAGCLTVYSASRTKTPGVNQLPYGYLFATRQVVFVIAAAVVMLFVMALDYAWLRERARFFYGITVVLLVMIFLLAKVSNGAQLSFDIGPIKLQPAEFAKVTVMFALAAFLSEENSDSVTYERFVGALWLGGIPSVLIILQPDLGSSSVLVALLMGLLLVAGAKAKYILMITVLALSTVAAAVVTGLVNSYQTTRITAWLNPNSTNPKLQQFIFQGKNALRATATGGLTGKGWLHGPITNTRGDIPVQWADFPFSAIGEQFGLLGCAVIIGLFGLALFRIWRIAHLSRDLLGTYICAGVFAMLLWQVFQNIAMTVGLMPITGLPLPFISYGGSGTVTYFVMFGLVQSVHMRRMR
ncbi:MAG: rodA [Ilumatobacteraceae bacterium]|nr:rodA [Ilumatobacteraceae bacterium]